MSGDDHKFFRFVDKLIYGSARSILENLQPWFSLWKSSSGSGKGWMSGLSTGLSVILKSAQILTFPIGLQATTIEVAQSE